MKLLNKTAIVTGARRGIGRAIAITLAREGANVVVSDIDEQDCQRVVSEIESAGGKALAVKCDVTVRAEVENMVATTVARYGGVDILVNNAMHTTVKPFIRLKDEEWDRTIEVNLKGPFICSQTVAKHMIKADGGRIINIASVSSGGGGLAPLMAHYTASKGGLKALSEAMAVELAPYGINVTAICPGPIDSGSIPESIKTRSLKMVPKGRMGLPEEVASLVVFLASPESEFITGSAIYIDGGCSVA